MPSHIIRCTARLASRYDTDFLVLYVQKPEERPDRIRLAIQRHLLNHFKLATELGGEVIQVVSPDVVQSIINVCQERLVTTVCIGQPVLSYFRIFVQLRRYRKFFRNLSKMNIRLIIFPA